MGYSHSVLCAVRLACSLVVALVALAACSGSVAPPPREARLHLETEPPHLNPLLGGDLGVLQVALGDVYEPLFRVGDDGAIEPVLAASATRSTDGRELALRLREGVSWHDGAPLTMADVVFTLNLLTKGGVVSPLAADVDDLEAMLPDGEVGLTLRFRAYRPGRERSLALIPVLPEHLLRGATDVFAHPLSRSPIGTGPFRFEAWTEGRQIRLARNPSYWGAAPAIDRVTYRIVPDRTQALAQLRRGELDLVASATPALVAAARADPGLRLLPYPFPYYRAVRWNCRSGPLADARVRRALTMLLDRETLRRELFAGDARLASGPWEPDDPAYDPTVAPWPYDPDAARALLAEAGVKNLSVRLLLPAGSASLERIGTIWQEDARRAGVALELVLDGDALGRARRGDFDGFGYGWTLEREQDQFHQFHSSQVDAGNLGACVDAETDRLLDEIRRTPDDRARRALEHALHRRLHELEPLTVISIDVRQAIASARLLHVTMGPYGVPARSLKVAR